MFIFWQHSRESIVVQMRVTWVFPKLYNHPIGGYKVHYQYANAMASRGHDVTLVHPTTDENPTSLAYRALLAAARVRGVIERKPPISWFEFEPTVRSLLITSLTSSSLPDADVTVLTAWQTAARTREDAPQAGVLAQIVYDYEFWQGDQEHRDIIGAALGRRDVAKIATSSAVASMLEEIGTTPIATIRAGLRDGEFGIDAPVEGRERVVVFALRFEETKDLPTAFEAVRIILSEMPDVRIECFGRATHHVLPKGIVSHGHVSNAELRALYNRASVFLLSSRFEGWGLPAAEAMACGAAVVATRCGGVEDFVHDEINGLLVPVGDPRALADSTLRLLRDEPTRVRLATKGAHDTGEQSLRRSSDQLEHVLWSLADRP